MVKNLPAMQETLAQSWFGKIPWRRQWLPTPAFLPGEFHGQRGLASYSPQGHKESDMHASLFYSLLEVQGSTEKYPPTPRQFQSNSKDSFKKADGKIMSPLFPVELTLENEAYICGQVGLWELTCR